MLRLQNGLFAIRHATGQASSCLDFMDSLLSEPDRISAAKLPNLKPKGEFKSDVNFMNVSFVYPGQKVNAVSNLSFTIEQGEMIAIVGKSGAGKSTVMDLILGLLVPSNGVVRIGNETSNESISRWGNKIAYVPQQTVLLSKSIRQNVAFGIGTDEIDDELVWNALEKVQLADFVSKLSYKLDTVIGPGGVLVSGGEMQRLGLSRALYTQPKLLLLDEATSALDFETELAISETLDSLSGDTTQVIVAHRLSTVKRASKVLHLEQGVCQTFGSLDEVRRNSPNFDRQAKLLGLK